MTDNTEYEKIDFINSLKKDMIKFKKYVGQMGRSNQVNTRYLQMTV